VRKITGKTIKITKQFLDLMIYLQQINTDFFLPVIASQIYQGFLNTPFFSPDIFKNAILCVRDGFAVPTFPQVNLRGISEISH